MIEFPSVYLPAEFSYLMQRNIANNAQSLDEIFKFIISRPSFLNLVTSSFLDVDEQKRIDFIIKNLGWKNFRDRLASIYIQYAFDNKYPNVTNPNIVRDLVDFEHSLDNHNVSGYSRTFMLAFYMKLCRIELSKTSLEDDNFLVISKEVFELLDLIKVKVIKLDWLILHLFHFTHFLGVDEVRDQIKAPGEKYRKLFSKLNDQQQKVMSSNMLAYTYATNDTFLFDNDKV